MKKEKKKDGMPSQSRGFRYHNGEKWITANPMDIYISMRQQQECDVDEDFGLAMGGGVAIVHPDTGETIPDPFEVKRLEAFQRLYRLAYKVFDIKPLVIKEDGTREGLDFRDAAWLLNNFCDTIYDLKKKDDR